MSDYDFLPASNGSGDAALMHIQTLRLSGSTTIDVDSVSNVSAKFIATMGTLGSDGLITDATAKNFKGHVSGSDLIIDAFEPGSTDAGSAEGDVVIIKPNTGWANRVAAFLMNSTNKGTPEAVTFAALAATAITASSLALTGDLTVGGKIVVTGTIQKTTATTTSGTTITPSTQIYTVSALAAAATIAVPSFGTWDGAPMLLRIKDNGTSRVLTLASGYTNISGIPTPAATVISKWLVIAAVYNLALTKWQIVSITQET